MDDEKRRRGIRQFVTVGLAVGLDVGARGHDFQQSTNIDLWSSVAKLLVWKKRPRKSPSISEDSCVANCPVTCSTVLSDEPSKGKRRRESFPKT